MNKSMAGGVVLKAAKRALQASLLISATTGFAKFAMMWAPAPASRLLANLEVKIKENPKDANLHYLAGRLHAYIYSQNAAANVSSMTDRFP